MKQTINPFRARLIADAITACISIAAFVLSGSVICFIIMTGFAYLTIKDVRGFRLFNLAVKLHGVADAIDMWCAAVERRERQRFIN